MGIDAQMFVKLTDQRLTPPQVRRLAWELGGAFGAKRFWIFKESKYGAPHHALQIVDEFTQDGDTLYPAVNEQFIEVHLATRYYGPDYERGDLPLIVAVAEWLEQRIPGAAIYYGGDSSGICAEPFDAAARNQMFAHFATHGHRPYQGGFGGGRRKCWFCEQPMTQYGSGGTGYMSFTCDGCGEKAETRDGGKTWKSPEEDKALA